jgi:hypothetical protein
MQVPHVTILQPTGARESCKAVCCTKEQLIPLKQHTQVPHFTTFEAQPHPDVKPMAYANQYMFGM